VEAEKQGNDSSSDAVSTEQTEDAAAEFPFDISTLDDKKLALAQEMGIPLKGILQWIVSVEKRFKIVEEEMPAKVVEALQNAARKRQEQYRQQGEDQGQTGSGQGIGLRDVLSLMGQGSGGSSFDEEMTALYKDMLKTNIMRMKQDMGFTDAIKNAIVTKIAGKAATDVME